MRRVNSSTPLAAALLAVLAIVAEPALAQIDFSKVDSTGGEIVAWTRGNLATIALTLAFVVAGFLAAFNKISWIWVGGIILGAILIFGAPAFIENLRGILS